MQTDGGGGGSTGRGDGPVGIVGWTVGVGVAVVALVADGLDSGVSVSGLGLGRWVGLGWVGVGVSGVAVGRGVNVGRNGVSVGRSATA